MKYPIVLSIAGSDSSGGAGIQADIKTMSAIGVFATTAITAITAQNTTGVTAIQGIDPEIVGKQIDAVFSDLRPDAVKIGMLFSKGIIDVVADRLEHHRPRHVVLDPVMISTSGSRLISEDAIDSLKTRLFPLSSIITPNRMEASYLAGMDINSTEEAAVAAGRMLQFGGNAVLVKGGHFSDSSMTDFLIDREGNVAHFSGKFVDTVNTHGTGCTLSSAIASYLALGETVHSAVQKAKDYLQNALEKGSGIRTGAGHGPLNHFYNPQKLQTV